MSERFFAFSSGEYAGSFDGPVSSIPELFIDCIEVGIPPPSQNCYWDFGLENWVSLPYPPAIKTPRNIAMGKLTIEDDQVNGFAADSAVGGGIILDAGKFMMFFLEPQPDPDYIVSVFDGGLYRCYVLPEDYTEDFFIITTTDMQGTPANPGTMSLIITRAV